MDQIQNVSLDDIVTAVCVLAVNLKKRLEPSNTETVTAAQHGDSNKHITVLLTLKWSMSDSILGVKGCFKNVTAITLLTVLKTYPDLL